MPLSLGVALIARDAASTLGACLESIKPWATQIVVAVDELTTDNTAKLAVSHGAEVYPVQVSDWHECAKHGRVLTQHFANARNESFRHLRRDLDWWMWIDADDVLRGGERLAEIFGMVPAHVVGVWLPYHYSTVEKDGVQVTNTVFHRERLLRADAGWTWRHRVHEVVEPGRQGPWAKIDDKVAIYHQPGGHRSNNSASRNLLLLEIDLETNPEDSRAVFYIGNQHFAMGDWRAAAHWYERLTRMQNVNTYELWQSYCYMALAYLRLEDLDAATQAAFGAIDCRPEHPEPYYHLAAIYQMAGQLEKALHWINEGRRRPEPPFFVFKNPMDYKFNHHVVAADSLAGLGRVTEARQELEAAHAVFPDDRVQEAIGRYRNMEQWAERASAAALLLQGTEDPKQLWEVLKLPAEVRQFGRVRDVVMPALLRQRPNTQPAIVFWCGAAWEEWAPPKIDETGIGGSETAVVQIARRFAARGWRVDVFNGAGRYEGIHDDVGYWDLSRLESGKTVDVLVSWRHPEAHALPVITARRRLLWLHDLNYGPGLDHFMKAWDHVLGVSAWHAAMLRRYYGVDAGYVPNGVDLDRFGESVAQVPWRCVYASSPDRGLLELLNLWPRIVADEPGAELHVAYGWAVFDKLAERNVGMQVLKEAILAALARTPQVIWRDRLPQDELARLYQASSAWLYPTNFLEVSCISAMEAMAGGCVPVVTKCGALPETIGNGGALVDIHAGHAYPAQPSSRSWRDMFVYTAKGVLGDPTLRQAKQAAGRERVQALTWDKAFEMWEREVSCD